MSHFLHNLGMLPQKEPFKVLVPVGVVMGETFVTNSGKYLQQSEVEQSEYNIFLNKILQFCEL
jgi:hypothetical protein